MIQDTKHSIILIDDECVMCNKLIRLIASADSKDLFRIAGLDSKYGLELIRKFQIKKPEILSPAFILLKTHNTLNIKH